MAGISSLVSATAIVSAAHVRSDTNALSRPAVPLAISVESDGDGGRVLSRGGEMRCEHACERDRAERPGQML